MNENRGMSKTTTPDHVRMKQISEEQVKADATTQELVMQKYNYERLKREAYLEKQRQAAQKLYLDNVQLAIDMAQPKRTPLQILKEDVRQMINNEAKIVAMRNKQAEKTEEEKEYKKKILKKAKIQAIPLSENLNKLFTVKTDGDDDDDDSDGEEGKEKLTSIAELVKDQLLQMKNLNQISAQQRNSLDYLIDAIQESDTGEEEWRNQAIKYIDDIYKEIEEIRKGVEGSGRDLQQGNQANVDQLNQVLQSLRGIEQGLNQPPGLQQVRQSAPVVQAVQSIIDASSPQLQGKTVRLDPSQLQGVRTGDLFGNPPDPSTPGYAQPTSSKLLKQSLEYATFMNETTYEIDKLSAQLRDLHLSPKKDRAQREQHIRNEIARIQQLQQAYRQQQTLSTPSSSHVAPTSYDSFTGIVTPVGTPQYQAGTPHTPGYSPISMLTPGAPSKGKQRDEGYDSAYNTPSQTPNPSPSLQPPSSSSSKSPKKQKGKGMSHRSFKNPDHRLKLIIASIKAGNDSPTLKNEGMELIDYMLSEKLLSKQAHKMLFTFLGKKHV